MSEGRLPTFVILGAMKAGTTSLYEYLREHPEVFMSTPKELDFFVAEEGWRHGLDWYRQKFAGATSERALGEGSPRYTMYPYYRGVPERMASVIPEARLVYVVRHPIQRLRSMYLHSIASGWESGSIVEAFTDDSIYVDSARYATQIDQFLARFPEEQLLVITAESLRHRRRETVRRVLDFIGVDATWESPVLEHEAHATMEKRAPKGALGRAAQSLRGSSAVQKLVPPAVRHRLRDATTREIDAGEAEMPPALETHLLHTLRPEIERLRRFVADDDFDGWGLVDPSGR